MTPRTAYLVALLIQFLLMLFGARLLGSGHTMSGLLLFLVGAALLLVGLRRGPPPEPPPP